MRFRTLTRATTRKGFRLLVMQHVAAEHLGRFRPFFERDGVEITTLALDEGTAIPALDGFDGIWALGGPMQVWQDEEFPWLASEKAAIREAVADRRMPFFGLCLGHQLLADALGGAVGLSDVPEVGVLPVHLTPAGQESPIFRGLEPSMRCTQGHGAEVTRAPEGAVILADSPDCAIQALGINGNAFSLQFHSELTLDMVDACLEIPEYKADFDALLGAEGIAAFRADVAEQADKHDAIAKVMYENWFETALQPAA